MGLHAFAQFLFFVQWRRLREYAHERGIKIIGDIPIFVSGDSADVWANPEFFQLDAERKLERDARYAARKARKNQRKSEIQRYR